MCWNQEPGREHLAKVIDCDSLGGANYCAKMIGPNGVYRTCAITLIMTTFMEHHGLSGPGCRTISGYTFCGCQGNKSN